MVNKHVKRCSTSLNIREIQIKTKDVVSPHTSQNDHHQKKSTNDKCWRGYGQKGTLLHCCWECKLIQLLWRTVWVFLKKLGIHLPYDPATLLLGTYSEKTIIEKDTYIPMFMKVKVKVAQSCPTPCEPIDYTLHGILQARILEWVAFPFSRGSF